MFLWEFQTAKRFLFQLYFTISIFKKEINFPSIQLKHKD